MSILIIRIIIEHSAILVLDNYFGKGCKLKVELVLTPLYMYFITEASKSSRLVTDRAYSVYIAIRHSCVYCYEA